jgi:predicted lipid-binding transport protein (Tim44 family)
LGIGLFFGLFHVLFNVLGILLLVALVFFIIRAITLGSPQSAWNSMWKTGNQWQQKFTSQSQQPPYYQPSSPAGQEQPSQPYGQGYQQEQPSYTPERQYNEYGQPMTQNPEQMPPMQQ